jgi:hypothetical protein
VAEEDALVVADDVALVVAELDCEVVACSVAKPCNVGIIR